MAETSGTKKALTIVGFGCLSIVVLAVVTVVITLGWAAARVRGLGDPTPEAIERTIAVADPAGVAEATGIAGVADAAPARPIGQPAAAESGEAWMLELDLEAGTFDIYAGPPGSDVTVEGAYPQAYYELTEEDDIDEATGRRCGCGVGVLWRWVHPSCCGAVA